MRRADSVTDAGGSPLGESPPALLRISELVKHFGHIKANDGINADFAAGEIHALLGENGAGKSTMINILSGTYSPDGGVIEIDGKAVTIANAIESRKLGIAVVHQHSTLIPRLSVFENVALQEGGMGRLDRTLAGALVDSGRRLGFDLDPDAAVEYLTPGDRQRVEIARALMTKARLVLLDEPTAVLTPIEVDGFFALLAELARAGIGVVFVTHHLSEALAYSKRITVLRRGRTVAQIDSLDGVSEADLVRMVVGDEALESQGSAPARRRGSDEPEILMRVARVSGAPPWGRPLHDVELELPARTITGVAGVEGNGQRELAAALTGAWSPPAGGVELLGKPLHAYSREDRSRLVADVPDDHRLATSDELSLWENIGLSRMAWHEARTPRSTPRLRSRARELVARFDIRPANIETLVGRLSGGNRRRVIIARELAKDARVAVLCFPTSGLDVRSAAQVRSWARRLAAGGAAVVFIGSDLGELLSVSDRLVVMARGRVTGQLDPATATLETIGSLMLAEGTAGARG
jgi:simple sugar transport system ATP-binding protein